MIVVVIQDLSCLISAIVSDNLSKGFIVSVFGVNIGIDAVFMILL